MAVTDCRHFTGYKPCSRNKVCDASCPQKDVAQVRILIVHLGALGAVMRSTSLLPAIKRKFPSSHLTWVTQRPGDQLLQNHPMVDRVFTTDPKSLLMLSALEFDIGFCIDKGLDAAGVLSQTHVDMLYGFTHDPRTGGILPATPAAAELWELGLDNDKKFFANQKPETQLVTEALELNYRRDPYGVYFSNSEKEELNKRHFEFRKKSPVVVGINTGCSYVIEAKKLTVDGHRSLIRRLKFAFGDEIQIVLLGGPEDCERNDQIGVGLDVLQTPTNDGLRDGLVSVAACDIVVTGDSLGMHMAIGLKKWIVAWFGPTCAHEIDLFDRGVKVQTQAACSPCWKRVCHNKPMCYDQVEFNEIVIGVTKGIQWLKSTWSFKQLSGEISSSPSP